MHCCSSTCCGWEPRSLAAAAARGCTTVHMICYFGLPVMVRKNEDNCQVDQKLEPICLDEPDPIICPVADCLGALTQILKFLLFGQVKLEPEMLPLTPYSPLYLILALKELLKFYGISLEGMI